VGKERSEPGLAHVETRYSRCQTELAMRMELAKIRHRRGRGK